VPLAAVAPSPVYNDVPLETMAFDPQSFAQMQRMVTDLRDVYRKHKAALEEVTRAHHEALFRLALAAEYRDDDTGAHIVRMGFLAEQLALEAGMPTEQATMLRMTAPMHDVGKIGISDRVLKKPGPFNVDERMEMNRHPEMGAHILGASHVPLFAMAAEVALSHHERWDGGGYPKGLKGEDIPLTGRIAAIADFFDAVTMDRCYRAAFSDERALEMLTAERGKAFDPRLVDAFVAAAPRMVALRDRINQHNPSFGALVKGDFQS
jgi:putative two-component system response regulator